MTAPAVQHLPPSRPVPGMSAAVAVNDVVYLAGQVAYGADGEVVGEGDCAAQTRQCFANISSILRKLGCEGAQLVSVTTFLANASDTAAFAAVRGELFPTDPPATTTVVAAMLDPRLLVEVQAVAVRSS